MVTMDWERVLSINPMSLKDEEIEDLYPMVIEFNVEEANDMHNLKALFKVSQEILQYKDNQIESLLTECDELKEKDTLIKQDSPVKKNSARKSEAVDESGIDSQRDSGYEESVQEMLREKNSRIETLMQELEGLERENAILKRNLSLMKDEMEDATDKMNEMTDEMNTLRDNFNVYKDKSFQLEQENKALLRQIEELAAQQVDRDKLIDDFGAAIDTRITEWKSILDEKDAEIIQLRENLAHTLQQFTFIKGQTSPQIESLNEEIDHRDKIIAELQTKLSEAVTEINEGCLVIEKLKTTVESTEGGGRRREHRDLLKKYQAASEKIHTLQNLLATAENDALTKSKELLEALATIRKYEDKDQGLTDTLYELKEIKDQLNRKNEYIKDLVNVINKLQELSSHQELQISSLREKLGMPDDEEIPIDHVKHRRQEDEKKLHDLEYINKVLKEENLELKSDTRTLKYKFKKLAAKYVGQNGTSARSDTVDNSVGSATNFSKSDDARVVEREKEWLSDKIEISKIKDNVQIVIEENEALRKGMHEILDSIRYQDGKSEVAIQSDTLERLLEALDIRHLAGWYHPAMRLQERLNVVQGVNSELRRQLKEIRKEMKKKDILLQRAGVGFSSTEDKSAVEECDADESKIDPSEVEKLQEAYRNDSEEWQKQMDSLNQERADMKDMIVHLELKLQEYENNWNLLELGEDDIRNALAAKSKEYAEAITALTMGNRKCSLLEEILGKESAKLYHVQKETIAKESNLKRHLADSEKRIKVLENQVSILQSNLLNSVSSLQYNELNEKYVECNIRLRGVLEDRVLERTKTQVVESDKRQEPEKLELPSARVEENDSNQIAKLKTKLIEEQQRSDRLSQLYDKSRKQLTQIEIDLKRSTALNSELRDQLIQLHQTLSNEMKSDNLQQSSIEDMLREYQKRIDTLQLENRNLMQLNDVLRKEAQMHYTVNSLKTVELDSLRHQILDLEAISEDKETIARLGFELTNGRSVEIELRKKNELLENDLLHLEEELEKSKKSFEEVKNQMQQCREQCNNRCKSYTEVIRFMQQQYAGSTSTTAWERYESNLIKLVDEKLHWSKKSQENKDEHNKLKLQQEVLSKRLKIVEHLKDMLEEQIGSPDVQGIIQRFSEDSQRTLNDFRVKRQISHLEYELQIANRKLLEYEATVTSMEFEMLNMQKVWKEKLDREKEILTQQVENPEQEKEMCTQEIEGIKDKPEQEKEMLQKVDSDAKNAYHENNIKKLKKDIEQKKIEMDSTSTQTDVVKNCSVEVQCEFHLPYTETNDAKATKETSSVNNEQRIEQDDNIHAFFNEQLNKALLLASERSATILKYESQVTEYQTKINSLSAIIAEKDVKLVDRDTIIEQLKSQPNVINIDGTDKMALKSTINSLQKLLSQKEETIARYQTLLKEDRDEHNKAAGSLQEEIRYLQEKIASLERKTKENNQIYEIPERDDKPEKQDTARENSNKDFESTVDVARLQEKISMLEADLKAAKELGQRWHQLAEDRLSHIDDMRSRLEEQHKLELESYRLELHKWQCETVSLRKQLSDTRMQLAKENISMAKELQEKDNIIQELNVTCQHFQNELEVMETVAKAQQATTYDVREPKMCEIMHNSSREQAINQSQAQLDCLRRQLQSLLDKEKMYKNQIADLKQQQSRRYMAAKTQEKKTSQREVQLDRKVKCLEEELQKTKEQLDKEFVVHEVKKAKTAEELALWEKQKKWQQTAEKLKERLKEKTEDMQKLQTNYEKMRSIVSCMEREKWYLRSKLKQEKGGTASGLTFYPSVSSIESNIVEDLQKECASLRKQVYELTEQLTRDDTEQLLNTIQEQKRGISSLESVTEGNTYALNQIEQLESIKDVLEKTNLKLENENFELRLEVERTNLETPKLKEKIEYLEKYVEILKVEKLSESIPSSSERPMKELSSKKSVKELEKTIFSLRRIVEKLQDENKRLKAKNCHRLTQMGKSTSRDAEATLRKQYELAKQRVVSLETDLQLAEQRIAMLENSQTLTQDNNDELTVLRQQLAHKSELFERVKLLLTRAAINEKALRQKIQQLEMRQTLNTIPECYVTPSDTK